MNLNRLAKGMALAGLVLCWGGTAGVSSETTFNQKLQRNSAASPAPMGVSTLQNAYEDSFLIGVALKNSQVDGRNAKAAEIVARQFSSLTAENDMKWQFLHPGPGSYDFTKADRYVEFGKAHRLAVIGHTLVWHSQTPKWVFESKNGGPATREELIERMRDHIHTVAGRYKGRIHGWDVVNEAVSDDSGGLRDSPWRRIIGDDYLDHAFRFAQQADPEAELYYNDYGLTNPGKRARTLRLLRGLIARGVPIDGVGMQGHYSLDWPSLEDVEASIKAFAELGLKVMITELDVDVLPSRGDVGVADISRREEADPALNPYADGLPEDIQQKLARRYAELFGLFSRYGNEITRVTFWGLEDGQSWLNHFPVRGRTNHPLLFDRKLMPKPAFFEVIETGRKAGAGR